MLHADLRGQKAGDAKASRYPTLPKGRFDGENHTTNSGLREDKNRRNFAKICQNWSEERAL